MFDGRTDRRQVSLRGNSKKLSRKDAIDKARIERQERMDVRARNDAAVRLSAAWRGSRQRGALRREAFSQLSVKYSDFLKGETAIKQVFAAQGKPFSGIVPPHSALTPLLSLGGRLAPSSRNSIPLLAWLVNLLRRNLQEASKPDTAWAAAACTEPSRASVRVSSLLRAALSCLSLHEGREPDSTALRDAVTALLQTWIVPPSWAAVQQGAVAVDAASHLCVLVAGSLTVRSQLLTLLQDAALPTATAHSVLSIASHALGLPASSPVAQLVHCAYACGVFGSRRVVTDTELLNSVNQALSTVPATHTASEAPTFPVSAWVLTLRACHGLLSVHAGLPALPRLWSLSPAQQTDIFSTDIAQSRSVTILEAVARLYTMEAPSGQGNGELGALVAGCVQQLLLKVPLHLSLQMPQVGAPSGGADMSAAADDLMDSDSDSDAPLAAGAASGAGDTAHRARLHPTNSAGHDPAHALAYTMADADPTVLAPSQAQFESAQAGVPVAEVLLSKAFLHRLCSDALSPAPNAAQSDDAAALRLGSCLWGIFTSALIAQILPRELVLSSRRPSLLRSLGRHWTSTRLSVGPASRFLVHLGAVCDGRFLANLWAQLSPGLPLTSPVLLAQALTEPTRCQALSLLCAVFAQKLMVMDDAELLEQGRAMELPALQRLVQTINSSLHLLAWVNEEAKTAPLHTRDAPSLALITEGVLLYRRLHERQSRNPGQIADGAVWLWPRISASDLSAGTIIQLHQNGEDELDVGAGAAAAPPSPAFHASHLGAGSGAASTSGTAASPTLRAARALFVITQLPMVVPFKQRAELFHELLLVDRQDKQSAWGHGLKLRIRRDYLFEDSMSSFSAIVGQKGRQALRDRMQITFISSEGHEEPGIDGGGLFQEWIAAATQRGFDPEYGLFRITPNQELYPSAASGDFAPDHLAQFEFLGRLLAKAVYEGMLVEPVFAGFFLNKLLGKPNLVDDLVSLDPSLHSNLLSIKSLPAETIDELGLAFETTVERLEGPESKPVVPGGSEMPVTGANVGQYITHVAHFRLNSLISAQSRAFLSGFRDVIPVNWLRMFSAPELQLLIGGTPKDMSVADMRANTVYAGGYHDQHPVIAAFWDGLEHDFTHEDRSAFLLFVTSCSRPPLLGFKTLNPKLAIHRVPLMSGEDAAKLPTSATCMNLLKLPEYPHQTLLRDKLKYAIHSASGFELS